MRGQLKRAIEPEGDVFAEPKPYKASTLHQNSRELTTVIDKIYDYISSREYTSLDELSLRMGLKRAQVEQMIDMLERGGLVHLKYSILPGENAGIFVMNKESEKAKQAVFEDERIKRLRIAINEDIARVEDSFSSIEHHLVSWSSEVEETATALNGSAPVALKKTHFESKEIQRDLELALSRINIRVANLNSRLSEMRESISEEKPVEKKDQMLFERLFTLPNYTFSRFFGKRNDSQETAYDALV
ncbi:MAG: hypothetical protein V1909_05560, partial [Candidatus Micrarchaeota archaeon]